MRLFLSGIVGSILSLVCLFYWWGAIITIIKVLITIFFIAASALALFLGYEEIRANIEAERLAQKEQQEAEDTSDVS